MPGEMSFLKTSHLVFRGDGSSRQKRIRGEVRDGRRSLAVDVTTQLCTYVGIYALLESTGECDRASRVPGKPRPGFSWTISRDCTVTSYLFILGKCQ